MSYKSLYRTYRPQTFEEVAGQKYIIQTLKNAIANDKVAHAYLFTGPRGTGKTTMAKLLAKALNCTGENKPCDQCDNCKAIADGSFPDVIEIDAASNNGVDEVRNLIDKVKYAPIEGKYKIYIIDEVHMMSQGAFNALLKTLEEPPAHVVFVLATTEPHKVLPTILSRCQRFDFGRISKNDIEERLKDILAKEDIVYDDGVVELVSELADGGMRDALSILDQAIAYAGDAITVEDIRSIYGVVSNEEKINFIENIYNKEYSEITRKIDAYEQNGIDITRLTSGLIDLLKEILIYKSSDSFRGLKVLNPNNCDTVAKIGNKQLFEMIDVLVDTLSSYRKAGSVKVLFEIACLKLCGLDQSEDVVYKEVVKEAETTPHVTHEVRVEESTNIPVAETKVEETDDETAEEFEESEEENVEFSGENSDVSRETEENTQESLQGEAEAETHEEETTTEEEKEETYEIQTATETKNEVKEEPTPSTETSYVSPNEEDLLNVLVQATKDDLVRAKQQWVMLPKYLNSNTTAKVASILLDGVPVAACSNVILIGYNSEVYLNRVYSEENYDEMNSFLKALYNKDMKCYCLTISNFAILKEKYMTLRQLGKLPMPVPIVIRKVDTYTKEPEPVDEGVEYAKSIFSNNLIIEEEK